MITNREAARRLRAVQSQLSANRSTGAATTVGRIATKVERMNSGGTEWQTVTPSMYQRAMFFEVIDEDALLSDDQLTAQDEQMERYAR